MRLRSLYPAGACTGMTREGKRCGIRDVFENGRCHHHGGQGKLIREILALEKLKRRTARTQRRARATTSIVERLMKDNPRLREMIERVKARNRRDGGKAA